MNISHVLVTGANGFVGQHLCAVLKGKGYSTRAAVRQAADGGSDVVAVGDIGPDTDWSAALRGIDAVVHLAARVHVTRERCRDPLRLFRQTNLAGSARLARAAAQAGVRRLIYLSSVKVHGEKTQGGAFSEADIPAPSDPYGQSKWEAEQALMLLARETGLEVVILRPPLVYGPGVKANFLALMRLVDRGVPLPFAGINNARSLIYVGNLVDAVIQGLTNAQAAGRTYLVADADAVSTAELIQQLAGALGRPARLLNISPRLLRWIGRATGRSNVVDKLTGSLTVDTGLIRDELGWQPPFSLHDGIVATTRWYRGTCTSNR